MIDILWAVLVSLGIAGLLGLGLALADKFLRVEEDPRLEQVTSMLPGANCGGCGFPGCSGYAEAIVGKEVSDLSACKVCKAEQKEKIKEYLKETLGPDGTNIVLR